MTCVRSFGHLLVWSVVAVVGGGCAPAADDAKHAAARTVDLGCAGEAERLLHSIAVLAEPVQGSVLLDDLEPGRFVYRCEQRGDWLAVMYPGPDQPVDCSTRSEAPYCRIGWVMGGFETEIFG